MLWWSVFRMRYQQSNSFAEGIGRALTLRLVQVEKRDGRIAERLEPVRRPRVDEGELEPLLEANRVGLVHAIHGHAGVERVFDRHAVVRTDKRAFAEIPAAEEIVLQARADDARHLPVGVHIHVLRRFEEAEIVPLLALHVEQAARVVAAPVRFGDLDRRRALVVAGVELGMEVARAARAGNRSTGRGRCRTRRCRVPHPRSPARPGSSCGTASAICRRSRRWRCRSSARRSWPPRTSRRRRSRPREPPRPAAPRHPSRSAGSGS